MAAVDVRKAKVMRSVKLLFLCGLLATTSAPGFAQTNEEPQSNPNIVRTAKGEYTYINQDTGEFTGHEEWSMIVDRSGVRTFNITQRWNERDYVAITLHRLDLNLRPVETFQTRWDSDGWLSSGVYSVVENTVTTVATGRSGRTTQTLEVPEKFHWCRTRWPQMACTSGT